MTLISTNIDGTSPRGGTLIQGKDGSGNAQDVLVDSDGRLDLGTVTVTGGGGGVEYTEGDTDATIVGSAIMWEDTSDTLRPVSASKPLPVDVKNTSIAVTSATLATAAKQDTGNTSLASIDGKITAVNTGAVVVSSSALPTGAATSAKQDDIITAIEAIPGGGGVQYNDGDAEADPDGTVAMGTDGTNIFAVHTDTSGDLQVDVLSSALPSGASTSAKQDTIIGHVDGIEGLLTTIDTDTGNISTKIDTLAGAVSGSEMQVDVLTMPTTTVQATNLDIRDLTNADVVTAELSATDNAVLDNIDADTSAIQTAVELIDDTVATLGTTTYTEATTKGLIIGAIRRDADTTLANTTNEVAPLQVDANGRLKVEAFSGETLPVSLTSTTVTGTVAVTQSGTWDEVGINDSGNSITVDYATTGSGNATGALRVELANNGTGQLSTVTTVSTVSALGTGTTGPQKAEDVASAAGDMGIAIMAARLDTPIANASVSNDGDYTTPILDNFRKVWVTGTVPEDTAHVAGEAVAVNGVRRIDTASTSAGSSGDWATMDASAEGALWTTLTPTTTSGCSIFRSLDLDESEEEIKATAGNVYGYYFYNAAASIRYLKFYNATAANVTVGTTTPVLTIPVPATTPGHVTFPYPIGFSTAISAAVTTGLADNDTGAPSANDFIINVYYK